MKNIFLLLSFMIITCLSIQAESILVLKNIAHIIDIEANPTLPNKIVVKNLNIWNQNDTTVYDSYCEIPITSNREDSITIRALAPYIYTGYDYPTNLYASYSEYGVGLGIMSKDVWTQSDSIYRNKISTNLAKAFRNVPVSDFCFERFDNDTIYFRKRHSNKGFYIAPDGNSKNVTYNSPDATQLLDALWSEKQNLLALSFALGMKTHEIISKNDKYAILKNETPDSVNFRIVKQLNGKYFDLSYSHDDYAFKEPYIFNENYVASGGTIINLLTEEVLNTPYNRIVSYDGYGDELILTQNSYWISDSINGKKYGYIDLNGNPRIPFRYNGGTKFHNGFALVWSDIEDNNGEFHSATYFISTKGEILRNSYSEFTSEYWDNQSRFGKSYGVIARNGRWGLVDTYGNSTFD